MHNNQLLIDDNVSKLLGISLQEDLSLPHFDPSSMACFPEDQGAAHQSCQATLLSKDSKSAILAGLALLPALIDSLALPCDFQSDFSDGDTLKPGEQFLHCHAPAKTLLMLERTLLNFLRHLSGVATLTQEYVAAISHTDAQLLDTRKTTPGMRQLEKYAVRCGGAVNHRQGLYDAIMIKDTHIDLLGGIDACLIQLQTSIEKNPELQSLPVIIEIRNRSELLAVLHKATDFVDRVLLDNMNCEQLSESVALCHNKIDTEASGNMTLENITEVAETGVNFISVGRITHSSTPIDFSMKIFQQG